MTHFVLLNGVPLAALLLCVSGCSEHETTYAPKYSEEKFAEIKTGDGSNHVIALLGQPLRVDHQRFSEQWIYGARPGVQSSDSAVFVKQATIPIPELVIYYGQDGIVKSYYGDEGGSLQGKDKNAVRAALGSPADIKTNEEIFIFNYTEGKHSESFDVRAVILDAKGRVIEKKDFYYRD